MQERETFGSRIGFILVSAGCAIGIGNVWKFPYLCGQYGGAAFILIYLVFLLIMGIPVMVCEFAMGRAGRRSAARCFEALEKKGTHWHHLKWISIVGCFMLMMYYTTVTGWMLSYCVRHIRGEFAGDAGAATEEITQHVTDVFSGMLASAGSMTFWTILVCVIGFAVCFLGIRNGVERVTKVMMSALFLVMIVLALHSLFLKGSGEGVRFYLVPDFENMAQKGIGNVVFAAMGQAFFTLSIGIGAMLIFGSYIEKERSLTGEAVTITLLDTAVAVMAGFIVIPACFAYGIEPDAGPSLIFLTIPRIFAQMPGGRVWGALFFVFLSFAALSTVIAVFENIIAIGMDLFGWSRRKSAVINSALTALLSLPCVFGYALWPGFAPLGAGTSVLDLEDFIVSNNLLPLGSLAFILFCTRENGWGYEAFLREADTGRGLRFPKGLRPYMTWVLPLIIAVIYFKGYYDLFKKQGTAVLAGWMAVAVLLMLFVLYCARGGKKAQR